MLKKILLFVTAGFLLSACDDDSKAKKNETTKEVKVCELEGAWARCSNNGGSSTRVVLTVSGTTLHETIKNFQTVEDCGGVADESFEFDASVTLTNQGESGFVEGGTDAAITPSIDLFGCGAGNPGYTVLKFNDDCSEFQAANQTPACNQEDISTDLDPESFVFQ